MARPHPPPPPPPPDPVALGCAIRARVGDVGRRLQLAAQADAPGELARLLDRLQLDEPAAAAATAAG